MNTPLTCIHCNAEIQCRKELTCPNCGGSIYNYKGKIYERNPVDEIVHFFEQIITDRLTQEQGKRVVFVLKPKSQMYKYERKKAEQFLDEAEGDLSLLIDAMAWLANNNKYSWRLSNSLSNFTPILSIGLAVIASQREEEKKKLDRNEKFEEYYDSVYGAIG